MTLACISDELVDEWLSRSLTEPAKTITVCNNNDNTATLGVQELGEKQRDGKLVG